jgi:TonB family protein
MLSSPLRSALFAAIAIQGVIVSAYAEDTPQADVATEHLFKQIVEWDEAWTLLRQQIWSTQNFSLATETDLRGRHTSDDVRDYVLSTTTTQLILEKRAAIDQLTSAGKLTEAQTLLAECIVIFKAEVTHLSNIMNYWMMFDTLLAPHRERWQHHSKFETNYRVPERISQDEATLVAALKTGRFDEVDQIVRDLVSAYAAESNRLHQLAATHIDASTLVYYPRRTQCPAVAQQTSGNSTPKLISNSLPDYPAEAKRVYKEGVVNLKMNIDATGCVTAVAIALSSGWPDIDDAALDWIETLQFRPAEQEGKAQSSNVALPLRFTLND